MRYSRMLFAAFVFSAVSATVFGLTLRHLEYSAIFRDANSKVIGYASIEPGSDNKTSLITVQLNGEKAGTVRAWEVRTGTCLKPANIWGNPGAYGQMTANKSGTGKRKAEIAIQLPDSGDFHINIKESASRADKVFLCSDFYVED